MTQTALPEMIIRANIEVEPRCKVTPVTLIDFFLIASNNARLYCCDVLSLLFSLA